MTKTNRTISSRPLTWFSADALSWSSAKYLGDRFWWLWRLRWHNKRAYGFAYNRGRESLAFYAGNPRGTFTRVNADALSQTRHGLGYPNESDLVFTSDGCAVALVRRDADTCTAQLGRARPPYRHWQWQDLGHYVGGPVMTLTSDNTAIVAGRQWQHAGPKTVVWTLNLSTASLQKQLELPSAGDCSYPGLVVQDGNLYISYYSSHEGGQARVYLAKVRLDEVEQ